VLSAVEGLETVVPSISHLIVPIAAVILAALFAFQRHGTGKVGRLFGPVMLLWFVVIAAAGVAMIVQNPTVLVGLSPSYAVVFIVAHPVIAFVAMGAVVLVITGAEALYADMGHFGRPPIRRAWFAVVFPALVLNYLGQAALILHDPSTRSNPFFLLFPDWARLPVVVLATAATVIASQAVISGAFSLTRQAIQLGLLPPLTVRHTSEKEGGQVYLVFRSSSALATAYGVSVTGALVVDTILLLLVAPRLWGWGLPKVLIAAVVFGGLEVTFLSANLSKVLHGGWMPLLVAAVVIVVMTTWRRGRELVIAGRIEKEGSLPDFIDAVREQKVARVPGIAIFLHPNRDSTPLALRANVERNHVLHKRVIIVSVVIENVPHVDPKKAFEYNDLGYSDDGIDHVKVRFGFSDNPNIPRALRRACSLGVLDIRAKQMESASYFVSRGAIKTTRAPGMSLWRKGLFVGLAQNAANPAARFALPSSRTVTMGSDIDI
jgi:KUP system potassium uptake protein